MPQGRILRQDDITEEALKVKGTKKLNKELFGALTGENGPLPSGVLPSIKAASEQGQKALMQAVADDGKAVAKPKKQKTPKKEETEEVVPKTTAEPGPQLKTSRASLKPLAGIGSYLGKRRM
eukprot:Skav205760  [mRNA]  locus=scaffold1714:252812:253177:- [translate_table: standard]